MNARELEQALQDLFEQRLDGEGFARLEAALRSDPAARAAYREHLLLEHSLCYRARGTDLLRVVPMDEVVARRQRRWMKRAVLSAAAVLVLALGLMAFFLAHEPQPMLQVRSSQGTEVELSHRITDGDAPRGAAMEPGSRLVVRHGTVELGFASGVRGVVRAPAEVVLVREDLLDLRHGTAWFHVPEQEAGFQVRAPDFVLTDLGTEFGIISRPGEAAEAHVFSGKVEIAHRHGVQASEILEGGMARRAEPEGSWIEIPVEPEAFLRELPASEVMPVEVLASASFTASPDNKMIRLPDYTFAADIGLAGFDPTGADKLIVALAHENGEIHRVTYGGVRMEPASKSGGAVQNLNQRTSIYFLDAPDGIGDLVVETDGKTNGVGGAIVAAANLARGGAAKVVSEPNGTLVLPRTRANALVIASHASNENTAPHEQVARALPPLEEVFAGPTGSSVGAVGFLVTRQQNTVRLSFNCTRLRPITAAAVFHGRD